MTTNTKVYPTAWNMFQEPLVFFGQDPRQQLIDLWQSCLEETDETFRTLMKTVMEKLSDQATIDEVVKPMLAKIVTDFPKEHASIYDWAKVANHIRFSMCSAPMWTTFIKFSQPIGDISKNGMAFEHSLLGALLAPSCLPKENEGPHFFENPSNLPLSVHKNAEEAIWSSTQTLIESVHGIFSDVLRSSDDNRHQLLSWIGQCLEANAARFDTYMLIHPC